MRFFGKCLRENIASPLLFAAIILLFILCGFGATVQIDDYTSYSFFELVFRGETDNFTAFSMAYKFAESSYYPIGLAIIAAVPALFTYKRSLEKAQALALVRTNYRTYSMGVVLSAFLSGAIITLAGILLYFCASFVQFSNAVSLSDSELGETALARLLLLLERALNHALAGGAIAASVIVLYNYLRSDFFAATIPMTLMYVSVKLLPNYREWLNSRENDLPARLLVIAFPSNLPDLGLLLERSFEAPFWISFILLGAALWALYFLFKKSIERT